MPSERGQFRFAHISVPANLLGALVTFAYFRFIDPGALTGSPGLGEILYFVVFLGAGNITQWAYQLPKELGGEAA